MVRKLKILVLSDYAFTKGGAERVAILSSTGLAGRGHEVVFFSAVGPVCKELKEAPVKDIITLGQKDILDNPYKLKAMFSGIYNRQAVSRLKKLLVEWKPDIVHLHGLSKALSWAPVNVVHRFKIPIVYTLHDYGLLCPNLGIYDFKSDKNCELYKPGCLGKCLSTNCDKRSYGQKLWRWLRFYISTRIFKISGKVSAFIAVSKFIKEVIIENLDIKAPVRAIYNPIENVESDEPDRRAAGSRTGEVRFLYVGRLSPEKGVDLLLEAMKEVKGRLVIIGDGELRSLCQQRSRKLGDNRIEIMGYQSKEVVASQMSKSDVLLLPSRCKEPAPLVLGEAAYHCLPAIVADHGGSAEFIQDGRNGLHFKAGDISSLISTMKKSTEDPILLDHLGKNIRKIIKEMGLDIGTHLDKIEEFYQFILANYK